MERRGGVGKSLAMVPRGVVNRWYFLILIIIRSHAGIDHPARHGGINSSNHSDSIMVDLPKENFNSFNRLFNLLSA